MKQPGIKQRPTLLLKEYLALVKPTDGMPPRELLPVLFGLFGEVGSVMAASKKRHRENQKKREVYRGFHTAAVEEFGDALWYLAAIARRSGVNLEAVFRDVQGAANSSFMPAASDRAGWPLSAVGRVPQKSELDPSLRRLGRASAALLVGGENKERLPRLMQAFVRCYLLALQASQLSFAEIAYANADKTRDAFITPKKADLPRFDDGEPEEERIPERFEIHITQRKSGRSFLRWNGVFIGDPLTDNIADPDGYRFHDVFHFAHAAVLHWSPVFRALIKQKRKGNSKADEEQDSGRAIVIEEGLTAWIFAQAKHLGYFAGFDRVPYDLLKVVQKFVAGYEVEEVPLKQWQEAILQGYRAFIPLRDNNGGMLIGDRQKRTLIYRKAPKNR